LCFVKSKKKADTKTDVCSQLCVYPVNGMGAAANPTMMNDVVPAAQPWTQGVNPMQKESKKHHIDITAV
jgi:hypothetical protein